MPTKNVMTMESLERNGMSFNEAETTMLLVEVWNQFVALPELHQDDQTDFCFHVHALQNILLSRPVMRKLNEDSR